VISFVALAIAIVTLAFVLWNGRQLAKLQARTRAANRRTWGAIAQMQLVALKAERLAQQVRQYNQRNRGRR
jgi:uncharacterized iron-regulated membrane protein